MMPSSIESNRVSKTRLSTKSSRGRTQHINDSDPGERELSESEIQDRLQDLDDVLVIFNNAREKLSSSILLLRESINLYQEFVRRCNLSDSNKYAMVAKRLKAKFILDTLVSASGRLLSVTSSTARTQALVINDLKRDVVDPGLLR